MNKQEAKQWAELFTAYAEGKTIQVFDEEKYWVDIDMITENILFRNLGDVECLRVKPTPKTRRMTNQKFADWLRDCPEEHREYKYRHDILVSYQYDYDADEANEEVGDVLIRRNHGEWEEPIIEVEEF